MVTAHDIGPAPLPVLDADRQAAAERLAMLLESADDAAAPIRAAIERVPRPGCWLIGADGLGLRIDELDGEPASLHPDRTDAAVAALDRIEPLLDRIEALTGWVVEPDQASLSPPGDAVVIALATEGEGGATRIALAVPPALASAATERWQDEVPGNRLARVPLPCRLRAVAAHLTLQDADALAPGDLLVLHPGPWAATLRAAPLGETTGSFDPHTGALTRQDGGNGRLSDGDPGGIETLREFRVPLEVRLPGAAASLAELAALREGGTLALGPLTAGLAVELSVAGRPVASGEIVRLGDRFAVVVERLPADAPLVIPADPAGDA